LEVERRIITKKYGLFCRYFAVFYDKKKKKIPSLDDIACI